MSTISICLIEKSVQNSFSRSSRLVVMVITIMFKGYKRFCKCLVLFNLQYKKLVLKVKEIFGFKNFKVLIKGVNRIMEFFKGNFPECSVLKVLYVILIYTISLSPKLGTIL